MLIHWIVLICISFFLTLISTHITLLKYTNVYEINSCVESFDYCLPNTTTPITYDITIETRIHEGNFTFSGNVKIYIMATEETQTIVLNQKQLNIINVYLWTIGHTEIRINWDYDNTAELLTIYLAVGPLLINNYYTIEIEYNGQLTNELAGFYHSYYLDDNNIRKYIGLTQFQSNNARRAFPCYDEPSIKSQFIVRIRHHESYSALSNLQFKFTIQNQDQMKTTEFITTALTSTNLITFIVSDFVYIYTIDTYGIEHFVYTRPNLINHSHFALEQSVLVLNTITNYSKLEFSLEHIVHVAFPDFSEGKTEHLGLIMYRETSLLWNDIDSNYINQKLILNVIAHAYIHQWFESTVTSKWTKYFWLNEGLATLLENYIADLIYPNFQLIDQMVVHTMHIVMKSEALFNTNSNSYNAATNHKTFDSVACILRMFMNAFTAISFQKGLNYYLTEREEDFFNAIEESVKQDGTLALDKNVKVIMSSWTEQNGYPIVYINRNYKKNYTEISQQRFLPHHSESVNLNTKFWIPLNFVSTQNYDYSEITPDDWLHEHYKIINRDEMVNWNSNDWIICNKQQSGYFRVQYDHNNWNLLINELNNGDINRIHVLNRAQLIDDSLTFAESNRLSWHIPFQLITYLTNEYDYLPWAAFENHLNYFKRYVPGLHDYGVYQNFIRKLIVNAFNYYGVEDIETNTLLPIKYMRSLSISLACSVGLETCLKITNERLNQLMNADKEIHPNLRDVLYCAGLRTANVNAKNYFWNRMLLCSSIIEQNQIINGLGCISNIELLSDYLLQTLNMSISQSIRQNIFNSVYQNSQNGLLLAIKYLSHNFSQLRSIFNTDEQFSSAFIELAKRSSRPDIIIEMENLLEIAQLNAMTMDAINRAHDNLFENIKWITLNGQSIFNWLYNNQ